MQLGTYYVTVRKGKATDFHLDKGTLELPSDRPDSAYPVIRHSGLWMLKPSVKYTKDLENVYEKNNEKGTAQTSPMEQQFFSLLSTCDSVTRELDATINEEHEILESLYQDYQQEAQLLEELGEEDITAERDILASYDKVTALICKLMEILYKHSIKNVPKIGKTRGGAQIQGPDLKFDSKEEIESIIHDVGQLFATQAIELDKLGKDQEETKNKYIKVKTNYQVLLQEKRFLETELRKLLTWRAGQNSPSLLTPSLEGDRADILSAVTDGDITHDYRSDEELEKVLKLFRSQDRATLQGEGAPLADSIVSSLHKKPKIQKEGDLSFSEIEYTYDLDQGDLGASTTTEPRDDYMVDTKISGGPESKDQILSLNPKEETTGNEKKININEQELKSWKRKGRRPNAVSSNEKMADQEDSKSSKTTIKRPEDKAENKIMQQVPKIVYNLKKSATKLQRTPSSSGKRRAKLNEGDDMTAIEPSAQTQRDKEQGRPSGPEPSKSVGTQLGRRQSLRSKSRHRSEEKLESDKQSQKDPPVKLQMPDKADKETAQSGNQLEPAMMFGDDPWMQHSESAWKYRAAGVVLSIGPQKEISKFQQDQVWKDLDDEFHEFPQSFESELYIQGISLQHSTENSSSSPSQSHNKQRGERRKPLYVRSVTRNVPSEQSILSTLTVKGIGIGKLEENSSICQTGTPHLVTKLMEGATSTPTPSEKLNSTTLKGEEPQKNPDQTAKPMGDAEAPDFSK
ncbi:uncharacterized protein CCDC7 isoform X2 [Ranitomeya imitator]|uniref:uncharacterized protein CCDC7 isoform X2 n=1 Tax=Ranitomeya imitator TaxID=111125 RepID=UPI0037E82580